MTHIETKQEQTLIESIENGQWIVLWWNEAEALKWKLKQAAKNTMTRLSRRKPVSIRLIESDLEKIKADALRQWIPYQTHISSIIHKYTTGIIK